MPSELAHLPLRIPAWSFADRIRKVRRDARWTIGEMAAAIEVGEKAYGAWESGRNTPASIIEIAVRLERVTGVPRTWFLGWDDEKAPTANGEGLSVHPLGLEPRTHWIFDNVIHGRFGEGVAESPEDAPENPAGQEASVVNIATRRDGQVA